MCLLIQATLSSKGFDDVQTYTIPAVMPWPNVQHYPSQLYLRNQLLIVHPQ